VRQKNESEDMQELLPKNGSSMITYLSYLPPVTMKICTEGELDWISRQYNSKKFTVIRERYIDIHQQLKTEPRGPKRIELVERAYRLENLDFNGLDLV
jgi:hypothetical protein